MSQRDRKERERQARIELILKAGARVFAKEGYHDASMDMIAEEAELGKSTLYYYYKSKDELLLAVLANSVEQFFINLESDFNRIKDPIAQIRNVIYRSVEFFEENPDYFTLYLYLNTHPSFRERMYSSLHPVLVTKLKLIGGSFQNAAKQGFLKEIPVPVMLSIYGSLVMGMGIFSTRKKDSISLKEKAKWVERIFLEGILK
jgi:AcrR family transcriptional regulator